MKKFKLAILAFLFLGLLASCLKDETTFQDYSEEEYEIISKALDLPENTYNYAINVPVHFDDFGSGGSFFSPNRQANHLATLGRVLFYDTRLSKNFKVSCASCHDQKLAFSDNVALSEGFDGEATLRNSLALATTPGFRGSYENGPVQARFAWDEANHDVENQSKAAIESSIEMGITMTEALNRVQEIDYYEVLFKKAFGGGNFAFTEHNMLTAISEFVNSISSVESKFDDGISERFDPFSDFENFTAQENRGKAIFQNNCSSCHTSDFSFVVRAHANNGIDINTDADQGVGANSGNPKDMGSFKVPFIRNIALTAPYMHDGRFATLREVIDHYSEGIQPHTNLDPFLKNPNGSPIRFNFTDEDKDALEAFLHTLTDENLMNDIRFSDPFR
jgi:cytochrome c peroxidase